MPTPATLYPTGTSIQTGFKNWAGSPPHLFGKFVGRPWQPWAFDEIYADVGLVIVRDDLFENTVGAPISFKTHNPGQVVAAFTLSQLASQSFASTGTPINAVVNGLMPTFTHPDYIIGEKCYYNTWRVRAINRNRTTGDLMGTVFAGEGVQANGVNLTTSSGVIKTILAGPTYVMNVEVNVNIPGAVFADKNFQVEVGFGGVANALATATEVAATPEWPAYTQGINATDV